LGSRTFESRIDRLEWVFFAARFVQKGHRAGVKGSRSRLVVDV
jgi:hypothetical protein